MQVSSNCKLRVFFLQNAITRMTITKYITFIYVHAHTLRRCNIIETQCTLKCWYTIFCYAIKPVLWYMLCSILIFCPLSLAPVCRATEVGVHRYLYCEVDQAASPGFPAFWSPKKPGSLGTRLGLFTIVCFCLVFVGGPSSGGATPT